MPPRRATSRAPKHVARKIDPPDSATKPRRSKKPKPTTATHEPTSLEIEDALAAAQAMLDDEASENGIVPPEQPGLLDKM